MRCEEVIRELAVPSDGRDDVALTQHLAVCESCALWADRAGRLDQLWDATRPADPAPEVWDRVWSSVSASLDQPAPAAGRGGRPLRATELAVAGLPRASSTLSRSWRALAVLGTIGLAQAAAVLLALGLSWSGPVRKSGDLMPPASASVAESVVDVPEGQVVYIRSVGTDVEVIDVTAFEPSNGEDPWFNFFNRAEGEAGSTIVATR